MPQRLKSRKNLLVLIGFILILALLAIRFIRKTPPNLSNSNKKESVAAATASVDLNREFHFPIEKVTRGEPRKISFVIEKAELRDEIVIKGQKANAVAGRTFLILQVKLRNELDRGLEINTKDYVRLAYKDADTEWFAADIHNDPVAVQAISTKSTRLGFPVDDDIRSFILQVGPINGSKDKIDVQF